MRKPMSSLMLVVLLGTFALIASPAGAATDCGRYSSSSVFSRARVLADNIGCSRARSVAIAYDRRGRAPRGWRCALGHGRPGGGFPRGLFTCRRGSAVVKARGVGSPSG
ncbi:MAG TPA: hypothetical protein VK279_00775 [Solirubrobacteraceae bacterium]|nr:hypothetical protein [Solirubrobacteraceae bacterium]